MGFWRQVALSSHTHPAATTINEGREKKEQTIQKAQNTSIELPKLYYNPNCMSCVECGHSHVWEWDVLVLVSPALAAQAKLLPE